MQKSRAKGDAFLRTSSPKKESPTWTSLTTWNRYMSASEANQPTEAVELIREALDMAIRQPALLDVAIAEVMSSTYEDLKAAVGLVAATYPDKLIRLLIEIGATAQAPQLNRGLELARLALNLARQIQSESERQPLFGEAELLQGDCLRRTGELRDAERAYARATLHAQSIQDRRLGARILLATAHLRDTQSCRREALELRDRALGIYQELSDIDGMGRALIDKATGLAGLDDFNRAFETLGQALVLMEQGLDAQLAGVATFAAAGLAQQTRLVSLGLIGRFWKCYDRKNVNLDVSAELDHLEGRLRRFSHPRISENRLRSALSAFRELGENIEAVKACMALMTVFYFEDRPRAARSLKKTLEELGNPEGTPPAMRKIVDEFCSSVENGTATLEEAEAALAGISSWRPE